MRKMLRDYFKINIFYFLFLILKDTKIDGEKFSGYNELDICFKIKKDVQIEENDNFNIAKLPKNNVISKYNPNGKNLIEFKKDTLYFVEFKKNPKLLVSEKKIDDINPLNMLKEGDSKFYLTILL